MLGKGTFTTAFEVTDPQEPRETRCLKVRSPGGGWGGYSPWEEGSSPKTGKTSSEGPGLVRALPAEVCELPAVQHVISCDLPDSMQARHAFSSASVSHKRT